ncbi:MAG: flagellar protein FlaI [Thermoprotei archaeon]|nr:MAG: flagellar protein FlaI [Thermoprotei archaeon]
MAVATQISYKPGLESRRLIEQLDEEFRDAVEKNKHLLQYLYEWLKSGKALPNYYVQLSRDLRGLSEINIIYPVGDPIFIHIYLPSMGERPRYHPIQPELPSDSKPLLDKVEEALAMIIDESFDYESVEEQRKLIEDALDRVIKVDFSLSGPSAYKFEKKKFTLTLSKEAYEIVKYSLLNEKVGMGLLEPFIRDPYVEDISCDGVGPIFVEHKIFQSCSSTVSFAKEEELNEYVIRLSERIGRPVSYRRPIVDAALPDGSRINIVFGKDVSRRGTNFTIRKFTDIPISVTQLIQWGTFDARVAAYLWMLLEEGMSVWVSGETASGKTTTLKAICVFIRPDAKIVSIEDTPEVVVPHDNWVREVTRESEEKGSSIELFDLLKAALRQRPNFIIVGEIRGKEGNVAFQAMQTGHPVLSTFHAASVEKLIQRLTGDPINVPKTYVDNLNAVVIQSAVRHPKTGRLERRVLSVNEMVGYDTVENRFSFIEIFSWDPVTDKQVYRGEGSSYILEQKIAVRRGFSKKEVRKIYEELEKRKAFLELLVQMKIFDHWEVWRLMKLVYKAGIDRVLHQLRLGEKP